MLSSTTGGFFMDYKIYTAEYKMALINEYQSRNITIRAYCKEKDISLSTFESWLVKLRKAGQLAYQRREVITTDNFPIDITTEAKAIIKEEVNKKSNTFTLETRGMKLTFSINNLKEVLEVINHD